MEKQKRTDYKRAFAERSYDRLAITIPKGQKARVEEHAKKQGLSINGFVNDLIKKALGLSDAEWKG